MRKWMEFVAKHFEIEVLEDNKIKIECIGHLQERIPLDHVITLQDGKYTIEEYIHGTDELLATWTETSIKEYLGY